MSEQPKCTACGRALNTSDPRPSLCVDCGAKTGLPPPAPALRSPSPCARCTNKEIVRVQMRDRTTSGKGEHNLEVTRPLALTWARRTEYKALFSLEKVPSAKPDLEQPFGLLEAYVCRACGHTELFAREPEQIPIGPEHGTELIVVPGDGTYR